MGISKNQQQNSVKSSDLNMNHVSRGVWLVKVPKYLGECWEKASAGTEIGKIRMIKYSHSKAEINLELSNNILNPRGKQQQKIPRAYKMDAAALSHQSLCVFSQEKLDAENEKLTMEGTFIQKFECQPIADRSYMQMKLESIKKASMPKRQIKQLDKIVINFKPVADHKNNIEFLIKKKTEGKCLREDKHVVMEILFAAFEKHQYYNIKDLVKITKQPVVYLKEILREFCNYSVKNPHKNMWELKPEYRHYKDENT